MTGAPAASPSEPVSSHHEDRGRRTDRSGGSGEPALLGCHARPRRQQAPAQAEQLSFSGRRWQWPDRAMPAAGPAGRPDAGGKLPVWLQELLTARGIAEHVDQQRFLLPTLTSLADPCAMASMDAAIARILQAWQASESICVYGDYDVDGVSASAVISEYLQVLGAPCEVYLPGRCAEGYGLNVQAVEALAARHQLMITVDCGSTSPAEIARAKALGMDTVVIDHHQTGPTLPPAVAILNPHRPDCPFVDKDLCATGVAFMLVVALRRAVRERAPAAPGATYDVRALLDLVAVATVADMVPLVGLNRVLVHAGLVRLRHAPRPGLAALMQVAHVNAGQCSAADLGFRLGPRINARGRLDHAGMGVDLMRCTSIAEATPLAQALDQANQARRRLERDTVAAAIAAVQQESLAADAAIVVADASWHPGVLGLVASRLVQRYHRPAIVIGQGGKGSARSIDGLNLHACLSACQGHLERFGGHVAAAGLTIDWPRIQAFRTALVTEVAAHLGPPPYVPCLVPDLEIPFARLDLETVAEIGRLEPYGRANPDILFAARDQYVQGSRRVGESHLKLRLSKEPHARAGSVDAIAFGMGDLFGRLTPQVDVLFHLDRAEFRGIANVQLRVIDLRPAQNFSRTAPGLPT